MKLLYRIMMIFSIAAALFGLPAIAKAEPLQILPGTTNYIAQLN